MGHSEMAEQNLIKVMGGPTRRVKMSRRPIALPTWALPLHFLGLYFPVEGLIYDDFAGARLSIATLFLLTGGLNL